MSSTMLTFVMTSAAAIVVMAQLAAMWMFVDMSYFEKTLMTSMTDFKVESNDVWQKIVSDDLQRSARSVQHETNRRNRQRGAKTVSKQEGSQAYSTGPAISGAGASISDACPPGPPGPPGEAGTPGGKQFDHFTYSKTSKYDFPAENGLPGQDGHPGLDGNEMGYNAAPKGCVQSTSVPGREEPGGSTPGSRWSTRSRWKPGADGDSGSAGAVGTAGPPGPPGSPGPDGAPDGDAYVQAPSEPGPPGPPGPPGKDGAPGPPGAPGVSGADGEPGQDAAYCPCPPRAGATESHQSGYGWR
ncbi:nematode cuticle collagen domain protein [Ostertagia ostertagi]